MELMPPTPELLSPSSSSLLQANRSAEHTAAALSVENIVRLLNVVSNIIEISCPPWSPIV
jgi:hypothetical protein